MNIKQALAEKHSLISETKFYVKSNLLIINRKAHNLLSPVARFTNSHTLQNYPVCAVSESELWYRDDNEHNWILTAGKIQNLRVAARHLHGVEVAANETFSFWRHVGQPSKAKGYVVGREIREGCIVPTVAGGLCQLSNALYDAALKAGFEVVERHRHTRVIKGSLAEQNRDATVKWNYIDLRFKSTQPFRIEIELTADKLIVQFRSPERQTAPSGPRATLLKASTLNDCYSCGNLTCFKHPGQAASKREHALTAFLLDEKWNEYDQYIQATATVQDFFIVPLLDGRLLRTQRYAWTIANPKKASSIPMQAFRRAIALRIAAKRKTNVFALSLRLDRQMAKAAARRIPVECTHLVVSQNLLPFLWEEGVLAGRTFDVLMTRLPMERLHQRLDTAHANYPVSQTLNDFRASQSLIELENTALTKARKIITPHQEIADIFTNKTILLDWAQPKIGTNHTNLGSRILFPASALGRKGAYEMRQLAQELSLDLVVAGKASEAADFWNGMAVTSAGTQPLHSIGLVVYPTYVEHQPRLILRALAAGIPVITTTACGLASMDNLTVVPAGDYKALKQAVNKHLQNGLLKATNSKYSSF